MVPRKREQCCQRPLMCPKPSDQPRDAARREECSDLEEKSLTTFVVETGGQKEVMEIT